MKKNFLIYMFVIFCSFSNAQYDQSVSINVSSGIFKTFGKKLGEYDPMQMPNYSMGYSGNAGIQYKISERFSLSAEFGYMTSHKWSYHEGDNNNYLYWTINDTITGDLIEEGENYLDLQNYSVSLKPKYYITRDGKLRPYIYSGITINWTRAWYENSWWTAAEKRNVLPPGDNVPYNDFLEENFGFGFNPGFGIEFSPGDRLHFYLEPGYYFISLKPESFKNPFKVENFNSFTLQAGIRFNFIKSKDL